MLRNLFTIAVIIAFARTTDADVLNQLAGPLPNIEYKMIYVQKISDRRLGFWACVTYQGEIKNCSALGTNREGYTIDQISWAINELNSIGNWRFFYTSGTGYFLSFISQKLNPYHYWNGASSLQQAQKNLGTLPSYQFASDAEVEKAARALHHALQFIDQHYQN